MKIRFAKLAPCMCSLITNENTKYFQIIYFPQKIRNCSNCKCRYKYPLMSYQRNLKDFLIVKVSTHYEF